MSSSWLDPKGSVTSGVPLGGWLPCGGGCVERFSWEVRESFWVLSMGGSAVFLFVCAIEGWFTSSEHGGRHCGVLCFFTTQAKCIHEGRIKRGGRVSPSYMHVSSTGWVGGIYTPNLYYIMTSMPLLAQNILRIFRAVGHFTGWNVQIVYSVRFMLETLSRRFSATFELVPDLREPS